MAQVSAANRKTSVMVDRQTLLGLHAVQAGMQADARRNLTLAEVVGQLAGQWQERRDQMGNDTGDQAVAEVAGQPSPCSGCSGGCEGSMRRLWGWVGTALFVGLIGVGLATGALRAARRVSTAGADLASDGD